MEQKLAHHKMELKAVKETAVTTLIPHRNTMLRLDHLLYIDDVCARACFNVEKDDPFLQDGFLREEALIETAAQTVAAAQGWIAQEAGLPNPEGLLIGMESFCFHRNVQVGDELFVFVEKQLQKSALLLVDCSLYVRDVLVAGGILKFYVA